MAVIIVIINKCLAKFKQRFFSLKSLPKYFSLVWETNSRMTIAIIVFRILRSITPLAILLTGKDIIDEVILLRNGGSNHPNNYIWLLVFLELVLIVFTDILTRVINYIESLLGHLFSHKISLKLMEHANLIDYTQFEDPSFYDNLKRANEHTSEQGILLSQAFQQLQDIITLGFILMSIVAFKPIFFILLIIAISPTFFSESYYKYKSYILNFNRSSENREMQYLRNLSLNEVSAKEIRLFGLSDFLNNKFIKISNKIYHENRKLSKRHSVVGIFFSLIGNLGYYSTYIIIIYSTLKGSISIGELAFLSASFKQVKMLFEGILIRFTEVSQSSNYLQDLFLFFEIKSNIPAKSNFLPFPKPIKIGFEFINVGFKYSNANNWAICNLNFTIEVNKTTAIVGENGSGKTTIIKLLSRLYEPTEGEILLDGINIKMFDINELRLHVGIIFQDFLHYQMTLAQNIAIGNISENENLSLIMKSAKLSLAHSLADKLPEKYNQKLGVHFGDGVELSGGEWQKIALARAYMKEAQILILDEPTSSIDVKAEYTIFKKFNEVKKDKTIILASHRFTTLRVADNIIVLQKGKLIESGKHQELIEKKGIYAELFRLHTTEMIT